MNGNIDRLDTHKIGNLFQLFCHRVRKTPDKLAYRYFDKKAESWKEFTWSQMAEHIARWQAALKNEDLSPGDRVALMANNSPQWVIFEQAALGLGLVVIPLYTNDRSENICYIIDDANVKVFMIEFQAQWDSLAEGLRDRASLQRIVTLEECNNTNDARVRYAEKWLPDETQRYPLRELNAHKSTLATIVYTSGTTGRPKGVMLSHGNILSNADSALDSVAVYDNDEFLSFLPLSHMFERTVGHYLPIMSGSIINYARSIEQLAEDLLYIKPTVLITVPRIFERVYNKISDQLASKPAIARFLFNSAVELGWYQFLCQQKKKRWHPKLLFLPLLKLLVSKKILAKLGGRLRVAVSGGAPLSPQVAKTFIGIGLTISQGYGMTETSPIVSTNKLDNNDPSTVGEPLRDVEVKLGEADELLVRSPGVMLGYWNNDEATKAIITADGWLRTGDKASIVDNHISITGRIKEIIVLSTGEKVPPADLEMAIAKDPLFDQLMVIGEQKSFLSAIVVLNENEWKKVAKSLGLAIDESSLNDMRTKDYVVERIKAQIKDFPGFANIYRVHNTLEPWNAENGLMTPTLKLKRNVIQEHYSSVIQELYEGH